jgi:Fur family iron response transcriptional regulator
MVNMVGLAEKHILDMAQALRDAGLRPTRQRLLLCELLWSGNTHRHVTAEMLYNESQARGAKISLATVYNALHQLTNAGLLSKVMLESGKTHFDTNTTPHQHMLNEATGEIMDVCANTYRLRDIPLPSDLTLSGIDIVLRVRPAEMD